MYNRQFLFLLILFFHLLLFLLGGGVTSTHYGRTQIRRVRCIACFASCFGADAPKPCKLRRSIGWWFSYRLQRYASRPHDLALIHNTKSLRPGYANTESLQIANGLNSGIMPQLSSNGQQVKSPAIQATSQQQKHACTGEHK